MVRIRAGRLAKNISFQRLALECVVSRVDAHVCEMRDKQAKKNFASEIESGIYSLHGIGYMYNEIVRNIVQLA